MYILILLSLTNIGVAPATAEFSSLQACEAAAVALKEKADHPLPANSLSYKTVTLCVPK